MQSHFSQQFGNNKQQQQQQQLLLSTKDLSSLPVIILEEWKLTDRVIIRTFSSEISSQENVPFSQSYKMNKLALNP